MTFCPGCRTRLHEGQDYLLHTIGCVYFGRMTATQRALAAQEETANPPARHGRRRGYRLTPEQRARVAAGVRASWARRLAS